MRRWCSSRPSACSRSSARSSFRSSISRPWRSARRPARPRSTSTAPLRPTSIAASCRSRARRMGSSRSAETASRSNGRSRCAFRRDADARSSRRQGPHRCRACRCARARVAAAHAIAPAVDPGPWIEAIGAYIGEHVAAFGETPDLFRAADVTALAQASRARYDRVRPLLVDRGRAGSCATSMATSISAISCCWRGSRCCSTRSSSSPLIASGDVLYDLAFLLMDLLRAQAWEAANIVLNRYLARRRRAEDLDALAALPLYLSMRAAIRAKVTCGAARASRASEHADIARNAKNYFDWRVPLIAPPPPVWSRSAACQAPASRRWRRALRPDSHLRPGAVVLRSDVERKLLFGKAETDRCRLRPNRRKRRAGLCRDRRQGAPQRSRPAIRRSSTRCSRGRMSGRLWRNPRRPRRAVSRPVP